MSLYLHIYKHSFFIDVNIFSHAHAIQTYKAYVISRFVKLPPPTHAPTHTPTPTGGMGRPQVMSLHPTQPKPDPGPPPTTPTAGSEGPQPQPPTGEGRPWVWRASKRVTKCWHYLPGQGATRTARSENPIHPDAGGIGCPLVVGKLFSAAIPQNLLRTGEESLPPSRNHFLTRALPVEVQFSKPGCK